MQWSQMKKQVESFFAPSVAGRVELRSTSYRRSHDGEGRVWITLDGEEIHDFCFWRTLVAASRLEEGIRQANGTTDFRDPGQRAGYYEAGRQAAEILRAQGLYSRYEAYQAIREYLSMSLDEALESDHLIVRALAVLDRRLGKRRLAGFPLRTAEHDLVKRLLAFRCAEEGVRHAAMAGQPPL
jgi:hypothetical protein